MYKQNFSFKKQTYRNLGSSQYTHSDTSPISTSRCVDVRSSLLPAITIGISYMKVVVVSCLNFVVFFSFFSFWLFFFIFHFLFSESQKEMDVVTSSVVQINVFLIVVWKIAFGQNGLFQYWNAYCTWLANNVNFKNLFIFIHECVHPIRNISSLSFSHTHTYTYTYSPSFSLYLLLYPLLSLCTQDTINKLTFMCSIGKCLYAFEYMYGQIIYIYLDRRIICAGSTKIFVPYKHALCSCKLKPWKRFMFVYTLGNFYRNMNIGQSNENNSNIHWTLNIGAI